MEFKEKVYREYECPTCKQKGCFAHCNHCGIEIKWLNHLGDPHYETKDGRRMRYAFEPDDTVHRCMQKGTKDGNYYNLKQIPDEYILDEHRKIYRIGSSAEFKCSFCNRKGDLPVMRNHHKDNRFDCEDKLMAKFFKEKPKTFIDVKNNKLTEYI